MSTVYRGDQVTLLCTTRGTPTTNPFQPGNPVLILWDKINDHGKVGYVSDVYVNTETTKAAVSNC